MRLSGAQALVRGLERCGVEVVFGLPGGAILPVYDPLLESSIRHVLVRHEQGAGHMAEGYAHVTGRPGVVMVTSGPGATNVVTALADAYMDSVPLVCVTGQVSSRAIGTDAFQEADITGITMGVTKHNWLVTSAAEIPTVLQEAFHVATTGRPGPVLVDIPKDVSTAEMDWHWPEAPELAGYGRVGPPEPGAVAAAAALLASAARPVLYVGGGVVKARASASLLALAELADVPVVTTLMARGAFPDSHRLFAGMPGMHGSYAAVTAIQQSDLLVSLGARFDDRVTGRLEAFAPTAKVVHLDIDRAELGKIRRPDVAIHADCKEGIDALLAALGTAAGAGRERRQAWLAQVAAWKEDFPLTYDRPGEPTSASDGRPAGLKPQYVIECLRRQTPPETILASGVGQHQMWAAQFWSFERPHCWVNSGGLGTMGFSVPAAIGAKVGRPEAMVWAIDGDGSFQMTAQELVTATAEQIPIKVAILNNGYLGMVRQWQEMFYGGRHSEVYLSPDLPNYVGWAEAMGCAAFRVDTEEAVVATIEKANEINDRPVVIDFRTDAAEQVFPMVPAGASNDEIVVHPSQRGAA